MQRTHEQARALPPLLTVRDVGEALAVSRATVYRLIEAGELSPIRVGQRAPRFERDDVQAFVDRRREVATV